MSRSRTTSPRHAISTLLIALAASACASPARFGDAATALDRVAMPDATALDVADVAAPRDAAIDAHPPTPLRLLAPLSTTYLAGRSPALRWTGGEDASQIDVQLCADRPCATVVRTLACPPVGHCAVGAALDPGVYFWRARAERSVVSTDAWTRTWQFRVKHTTRDGGGAIGLTLDLDGDGRDDIVYASYVVGYGPGEQLWLRYGAALDAPVSFVIDPEDGESYSAIGCAGGDLNGDGLGDLVVGERASGMGLDYWVWYRGGVAGLLPVASDRFGVPAANSPVRGADDTVLGPITLGAGDMDGDGYGDVIATAWSSVGGNFEPGGCVYLYPGGPSGPQPDHVEALCDRGTGSDSTYFGHAIAAGGDLDGDGFTDAVVASGDGMVRLRQFFGGPTGLGRYADVTTLPGLTPCTAAVTMVGDVDADGFADIALCAGVPGGDAQIDLFLGGPSGLASTPAGIATFLDAGVRRVGGVVAGGDLDGDGYDDVVLGVGAARNGPPPDGVAEGAFAIYAGTSTGLANTARVVLYGPDGYLGWFGQHVAIPGDVDGDGLADLVVTAYGASTILPDRNFVGGVYLYPGPVATSAAVPSHTWHGPPNSMLGFWVAAGAL